MVEFLLVNYSANYKFAHDKAGVDAMAEDADDATPDGLLMLLEPLQRSDVAGVLDLCINSTQIGK